MIMETWTFWCLVGIFVLLALGCNIGWIFEGMRLSEERAINRKNEETIRELMEENASLKRKQIINVANTYYKEQAKQEVKK